MVEDIAWWVLVTIAGIVGIFVPMTAIVAARDVARKLPPFVAGPICASGIVLPLLSASFQADDTLTLLDIASAILWLIALIVIARAYRYRGGALRAPPPRSRERGLLGPATHRGHGPRGRTAHRGGPAKRDHVIADYEEIFRRAGLINNAGSGAPS